MAITGLPALLRSAPARVRHDARLPGELVAVLFMASIALLAQSTQASVFLFPELGAIAFGVCAFPRGAMARAPGLVILTPVLTAVIGTVITQHLPYDLVSVLLSVGSGFVIVRVLRSPVAPAIAAGLLPLTLGETSWLFPPAVMLGTGVLALFAVMRNRLWPAHDVTPPDVTAADSRRLLAPGRFGWAIFAIGAIVLAFAVGWITGCRMVLFPPLTVIAYYMFAHPDVPAWAHRSWVVPVACVSSAAGGMFLWSQLGDGPLTAALAMVWGLGLLRALDLYLPPVLAVALLPIVINVPDPSYPVAVGLGAVILTATFMVYRRVAFV